MSGTLISQAAYARRVKISPQLLAHHIKVGNVDVHGDRRLICVEDADAALRDVIRVAGIPAAEKSSRPESEPPKTGDRVATLHEARAERARQDAQRAEIAKRREEIELGLLSGRIVYLDDVEAEWASRLAGLRSRLISIPSRIAGRVAAEPNPQIVREMLDDEIRLALEDISNGRAEIPAESDGRSGIQRGPTPAAKAKRKRVG